MTLSCNQMTVTQGKVNEALAKPYQTAIIADNKITVSIEQSGRRITTISSESEVSCDELFETFQIVDKLLMLFDGKFYPIEKIEFLKKNSNDTKPFIDKSKELMNTRLTYYSSKDFCRYDFLRLLDFSNVFCENLFKRWKLLLEQMDISYQVFLYSLSDNGNPVDMNMAFLVELAEPFVELIKDNTYYCQTLSPGERGTTLKMCLDTIITHFGTDIFSKELKNDYTSFLEKTIGSRVRIMHIKKRQQKYYDGKNCIRYSMKLSLLYRKILFELLCIPYDKYKSSLLNAIDAIDSW